MTNAPAQKPAGPKPLTPEQRAAHLPFLPPDAPKLADDGLVHQTVDGMVVIEAEHYTRQFRDQIRRWYLNSARHTHADQGPPHPATPVCRAFEAGEHQVEICGRSAGHMVDQIVLRRFAAEPLKDTPGATLP